MILAADTLETLQAPFNTKKWTSTLVKPTIQTFSTKFNKDQAVVNYEKNKKKAVKNIDGLKTQKCFFLNKTNTHRALGQSVVTRTGQSIFGSDSFMRES